MNAITRTLSPSATTQIRADHAHVLTTFHQYQVGMDLQSKRVLVNTVCRALMVHAQLEEEIFYPALRELDPGIVDKHGAEHDAMHRLIADLRHLDPAHADYDALFMELMHTVMRHVADEEAIVLPQAERAFGSALNDMGATMLRRRVELLASIAGEMFTDTLRAPSIGLFFAAAGTFIGGAYAARHALKR